MNKTNALFASIVVAGSAALAVLPLGPVCGQSTTSASGPVTQTNANVYQGGPGHNGFVDTQLPASMAVAWQNTPDPKAYHITSPAAYNGVLYFGCGPHVYALSCATGAQIWKYPTTDDDSQQDFNAPPVVEDGVVYIGCDDGKLYALDAKTGENQMQFAATGAIEAAPVIAGGNIYFGSTDNYLYAFRLKDQHPLWGSQFRVNGSISTAPAVAGEDVYFGDESGTVYDANTATGRIRWSYKSISGLLLGTPVFESDNIFIAANRSVTALVARSGAVKWSATLPSEVSAPLAVGGPDDLAYAATSDDIVYAISSRGRTEWQTKVGDSVEAPLVLTQNLLLVGTTSGVLYGLSPESGKLLWQYEFSAVAKRRPLIVEVGRTKQRITIPRDIPAITRPPVVAGGVLYQVTQDATITALSARAADNVAPAVLSLFPTPDYPVSGIDIPYQIKLLDIGSGVSPATIALKVDGQDVPVTYDVVRQLVVVKQDPAVKYGEQQLDLATLKDGLHTATITAQDWRGNTLTRTWSFQVDAKVARVVPGERPRTNPNNNTGFPGMMGQMAGNQGNQGPNPAPSYNPQYSYGSGGSVNSGSAPSGGGRGNPGGGGPVNRGGGGGGVAPGGDMPPPPPI